MAEGAYLNQEFLNSLVQQTPEHLASITGGQPGKCKYPNSNGLSKVLSSQKRTNLTSNAQGRCSIWINNAFRNDTFCPTGTMDDAVVATQGGLAQWLSTVPPNIQSTAVRYRAIGECARVTVTNPTEQQSGRWVAAPEVNVDDRSSGELESATSVIEQLPGATTGSLPEGCHIVLAHRPHVTMMMTPGLEISAQPFGGAMIMRTDMWQLTPFVWTTELFYPAEYLDGGKRMQSARYRSEWSFAPTPGPVIDFFEMDIDRCVDRAVIQMFGITVNGGEPGVSQFGTITRVKVYEITVDGQGDGSHPTTNFTPAVQIAERPAQVHAVINAEATANNGATDLLDDMAAKAQKALGWIETAGKWGGALEIPGAGAAGVLAGEVSAVLPGITTMIGSIF